MDTAKFDGAVLRFYGDSKQPVAVFVMGCPAFDDAGFSVLAFAGSAGGRIRRATISTVVGEIFDVAVNGAEPCLTVAEEEIAPGEEPTVSPFKVFQAPDEAELLRQVWVPKVEISGHAVVTPCGGTEQDVIEDPISLQDGIVQEDDDEKQSVD